MNETLHSALEFLILPFLGWVAKALMGMRDEIKTLAGELRAIKQEVLGIDGTNGHRGQIKSLRESRHEHATKLTEHDFRLDALEKAAE